MWVKICGTTNVEDALVAVNAGADAVGFVFAESARRVTAEQVAEMTRQLPASVEKIGVFTTQDPDEIFAAAVLAALTGVQLHSNFLPSLAMGLKTRSNGRLKVIQVVDISATRGAEESILMEDQVQAIFVDRTVDNLLLDTAVGGTSGGTGVTFDWERAANVLKRQWPREMESRIIVAGGLRPENVGEAIAWLRPWGVDVASGVEVSKGKKDAARVREFVAAAHEKG